MPEEFLNPTLPEPYMKIPSRHLRFWTQEFLEQHLVLLNTANLLGKAKKDALDEARRSHFLDFQTNSQDEYSLVLHRDPLPRGCVVTLGRGLLYAMFLGIYVLFDPYLKKPRLLKVKLVVNDQLETSVYALEWE